MPLYHISCHEYNDGQVLPIREIPSGFHNRSVEAGFGWINDILEECSPEDAPIRSRAYFAFENIAHCVYYFSKTPCEGHGPYLYEVQLENSISAPMVLTDLIREVGQDFDHLEALTSEYWDRTRRWNFIEHLGSSMTIIRRIEDINTKTNFVAGEHYMDDIKLRKQIKKELE